MVRDNRQPDSNSDSDILTPEQKDALIENIAQRIVDFELGTVASIILGTFKPISYIWSSTALLTGAPFLEFFGIRGYDYAQLFRDRDAVDKLLERIEKLTEEKEREKLTEKKKGKKG